MSFLASLKDVLNKLNNFYALRLVKSKHLSKTTISCSIFEYQLIEEKKSIITMLERISNKIFKQLYFVAFEIMYVL